MAAKFEVRQGGKSEFRFVLVSQGRVLATSEAYSRKASCVNAIESLRKAASVASVDDTTTRSANGASAAKPAAGPKAAKASAKATAPAAKTVAKAKKVAPTKRASRSR